MEVFTMGLADIVAEQVRQELAKYRGNDSGGYHSGDLSYDYTSGATPGPSYDSGAPRFPGLAERIGRIQIQRGQRIQGRGEDRMPVPAMRAPSAALAVEVEETSVQRQAKQFLNKEQFRRWRLVAVLNGQSLAAAASLAGTFVVPYNCFALQIEIPGGLAIRINELEVGGQPLITGTPLASSLQSASFLILPLNRRLSQSEPIEFDITNISAAAVLTGINLQVYTDSLGESDR
jgi:hypothetical protein